MVVTLNLNFQLVWPCLNHDEGEEDGRGLCTSCNRRVVNFGKMEFKAKREVRQHSQPAVCSANVGGKLGGVKAQ